MLSVAPATARSGLIRVSFISLASVIVSVVILERKAKNGHRIEVDVVPIAGLEPGEFWSIFPADDHYLVALGEEMWFSILRAVAPYLNPHQTVFLFEAWLAALIDSWVDMELEAAATEW